MMREVLEYLKECGVFFIAADEGGRPGLAPFSEVCGFEGHIYIMAEKDTDTYRQLKASPLIAIGAVHPDKSWIRISGRLTEDDREAPRRAMQESCRDTLTNVEVKEDSAMTVFRLEAAHAEVQEAIGKRRSWDLP